MSVPATAFRPRLPKARPDVVVLRFPLPAAQHAALVKLANRTGLSKDELVNRLLEPEPFEGLVGIVQACAAALTNRREQLAADDRAELAGEV